MVDLVRRGFQLVFDEPDDEEPALPAGTPAAPRRGRTLLTAAPKSRPFSDAVARMAGEERLLDDASQVERESLGRKIVLSALRSAGAAFPSGFSEDLRALDSAEPHRLRGTPSASGQPAPRPGPKKPATPQGPSDREGPQPPAGRENAQDPCETLRVEKERREAAYNQVTEEIAKLNAELEALRKERREGMPSVNDEDRRAGRKPTIDPSEVTTVEKDTPEGQRRRGGRPPRFGVDLPSLRDEMIRHRDTAQRRLRRAEEIEVRTKEIHKRLDQLHGQRVRVGREASEAELRYTNCRVVRGRRRRPGQ